MHLSRWIAEASWENPSPSIILLLLSSFLIIMHQFGIGHLLVEEGKVTSHKRDRYCNLLVGEGRVTRHESDR